MLKINILKKGDSVIFMNERVLAVKRKNGTVDLFRIAFTQDDLYVDPVRMAVIGYGEGLIEREQEDGVTKLIMF